MKKIIIDDTEYVPAQENAASDVRIVILQRGTYHFVPMCRMHENKYISECQTV